MTSDRKIRANHANARASTGPKTTRCRARAARNALRHGLSLPVCSDPALSEEVEALAREVAGTEADAKIQDLARRVAEAQIDLRRERYARHQLLSRALNNPNHDSRDNERKNVALLGTLLRGKAPDMPMEAVSEYLTSTPEGPQKFAILLSQEAKQLLAMDRYERRALFRRRIAIQALTRLGGKDCRYRPVTINSCRARKTKPNS